MSNSSMNISTNFGINNAAASMPQNNVTNCNQNKTENTDFKKMLDKLNLKSKFNSLKRTSTDKNIKEDLYEELDKDLNSDLDKLYVSTEQIFYLHTNEIMQILDKVFDDEKIKELLSDIGIDTNIHGESLSDNTAEIFLNSENAENILMSELQTLMSKSKDDSINNLDDAKKSSKIIDRISSAITAKFFEGLVEKGVNEKLNNEIFLNNSENLFGISNSNLNINSDNLTNVYTKLNFINDESAIEKLVQDIKNSIKNALNNAVEQNMLNKEEIKVDDVKIAVQEAIGESLENIQKEWIKEKSLLSNENPSIRPYEEVMDKIKEKLFEKTASSISKFSANKTNVNQDKKEHSLSTLESKEDRLLKNLALGNEKDTDYKFDRVMNLMSHITKSADTVFINKSENIVINRDTLVNDIIKSVKYMELNDIKQMTVKIMPKELGEVTIKITMENGLMKANITASNKDAYNLLRSNLQDLNEKLSHQQIKIQNFTVDIYNGDTTFFSRENSNGRDRQFNSKKNSGRVIAVDDDSVIEDTSLLDEENGVNVFV
ncbi:flagellar hook-length control protein FliK [Clostridium colicanis]|uniref:Flagellar hook-length control protein FliK n=1 Tax=Clostridium colicanis DSM 13634 TaxID=1121305 RepID=A0A151AQ55_9CLOT|nr:flagellar hook-length control protein FliK [Clostridium colicanis]KYH29745.1 flagellar hook-length control protein FliK [Clostridium colicanis DSM 13634]